MGVFRGRGAGAGRCLGVFKETYVFVGTCRDKRGSPWRRGGGVYRGITVIEYCRF